MIILSQTSKESSPFIVDIVSHADSRICHEEHTCQSSGTEKNTRECLKDHISYQKAAWDPKWNRIWGSVSV